MTQSTSPDRLDPLDKIDTGATVVITHKVSHANTPAYETWLTKIREKVTQAQGFLDSQVIRPVAGLTETYTVILRFDTIAHLTAWMHSDTRNGLIAEVTPFLQDNENFHIQSGLNSGLEFLFADATPTTANAPQPPKRWKQFLLTWSAIFPLVSIVSGLVGWLLASLQLELPRLVVVFFMTAIVVFCMVYIVMPRYTKLVKNWLNS